MDSAKKIGVLLLTVSIIMIISGTVCSFIVSLKDNQEKTQARMIEVKNSYEDFNASVLAFETQRTTLYTDFLGNIDYNSLVTNDLLLKEKLNNYESIVDDVIKYVSTMDSLCDDVYYPDSEVNNICSNYKLVYEQVVNYFMDDITLYNTAINKLIVSGNFGSLIEYKTDKEYIDYNGDRVFEGKNIDLENTGNE